MTYDISSACHKLTSIFGARPPPLISLCLPMHPLILGPAVLASAKVLLVSHFNRLHTFSRSQLWRISLSFILLQHIKDMMCKSTRSRSHTALEGFIQVITLPQRPHATHHYIMKQDSRFFFVPPCPSKNWAFYSGFVEEISVFICRINFPASHRTHDMPQAKAHRKMPSFFIFLTSRLDVENVSASR